MNVSWFSAGVSSAVATKLAIADIDQIIYTHIDDQHPDTMRFIRDCEAWFGKPVQILQSQYKSVESAIAASGSYLSGVYLNGPRGASCTRYLKRRVRREWELEQVNEGRGITYVWGMDTEEIKRCNRLRAAMPEQKHRFPLIEHQMTKAMAHEVLRASGIKRPAMYDLGYQNNNCVGCVKGGMGYWNRIRVDFPDVFKRRAEMERRLNATCLNGTYLDQLDPAAGRDETPIDDECGIFCELMRLR